jgi:NAD(P)-dependent dehydrogenase (short-subunit alcohol dehydrogenase family)
MARGFDAAGQVAVVTGGGSGIGAALCRLFARSGVRGVVVADLDHERAQQVADAINRDHTGCPAHGVELDVADSRSVEALVEQVETEVGPIAAWCSNAGVHMGDALGDADDWRKSFDVNVMGHVNAARSVIPRMARRKAGHIVITASAAGLLTDFRCAPYAASKHAAVALAEWLSITHADDGVSISCVCPEGVRTGMTRPDSLKAGVSSNFLEPEDVAREILETLKTRCFLVLPHSKVAKYEQRRAADREKWLDRMRAARRRLTQTIPSAVAS